MPFSYIKPAFTYCLAIGAVSAQDGASFCTSTPSATNDSVPLNLNITGTTQFPGLHLGGCEGNSCSHDTFAPKTIHWHIYTLEDGDDEPRIAMTPSNLVAPLWKESEGNLLFYLKDLESSLYGGDDPIQAGAALWLPASYMTEIDMSDVDVSIQYNGTNPMNITHSGSETSMSVTSFRAPVHYTGTGRNTEATLVATGAVGSRIEVSGHLSHVAIAVPTEDANSTATMDDLLQVELSGVSAAATIEGAYGNIFLEGLDSYAIVNTNCDRVTEDRLNGCTIIRGSTLAIAEDDLACLADTVVERVYLCGQLREAIMVLVWFVALVTVVLIGIGTCVACNCLCFRPEAKKSANETAAKTQTLVVGRVVEAEAPMPVQATAASTIAIDPHLITAKTGTEQPKSDMTEADL